MEYGARDDLAVLATNIKDMTAEVSKTVDNYLSDAAGREARAETYKKEDDDRRRRDEERKRKDHDHEKDKKKRLAAGDVSAQGHEPGGSRQASKRDGSRPSDKSDSRVPSKSDARQ